MTTGVRLPRRQSPSSPSASSRALPASVSSKAPPRVPTREYESRSLISALHPADAIDRVADQLVRSGVELAVVAAA